MLFDKLVLRHNIVKSHILSTMIAVVKEGTVYEDTMCVGMLHTVGAHYYSDYVSQVIIVSLVMRER